MNFSENIKQGILKTGKFLWQDFVAFVSKCFFAAHSAMKGSVIMYLGKETGNTLSMK